MTDLPNDDEVIAEPNSLTGVVSPEAEDELPTNPFDLTIAAVTAGAAAVRDALKIKRAARDDLNDEIRQLVAEERMLSRLERVAREKLKLD